jgi:hypothetical protein
MTITLKHVGVAHTGEGDTWTVTGSDKYGYEYTICDEYHAFRALPFRAALKLVEAIKAAGCVINENHWLCRAPYGTEAWLMDGMEERDIEDERFGYC